VEAPTRRRQRRGELETSRRLRRVKTQGSFPTEDAGLVLLYALVASSQIKLRKLDGYEKIVDVISNPRGS
jgi:hypothetical protein